ncbi:unnamed protein product [Dicrocoelium dendriticum]|nr:unnamed protein product [Dicrocoelium dendriticum]
MSANVSNWTCLSSFGPHPDDRETPTDAKFEVWISNGDIILVGLRDYQDKKADVIMKYLNDEARTLKSLGEIPDTVKLEENNDIEFDANAALFEEGDGEEASDSGDEDESDSDEEEGSNSDEAAANIRSYRADYNSGKDMRNNRVCDDLQYRLIRQDSCKFHWLILYTPELIYFLGSVAILHCITTFW